MRKWQSTKQHKAMMSCQIRLYNTHHANWINSLMGQLNFHEKHNDMLWYKALSYWNQREQGFLQN